MIYPAPSVRVKILASSPGESHRFHCVMRTHATLTHPAPRSWTVEDGQAVLPTARNRRTTHLDGKPAPSVYMQALHGLLISRHWESEGREFGLFCCFGNQSMQVTSFSCVSQRTCLGWLYGAAISINFLSFVSLCRNLHVV